MFLELNVPRSSPAECPAVKKNMRRYGSASARFLSDSGVQPLVSSIASLSVSDLLYHGRQREYHISALGNLLRRTHHRGF